MSTGEQADNNLNGIHDSQVVQGGTNQMEKYEIIQKICEMDATAQLGFLEDFSKLDLEHHLKLLVEEARAASLPVIEHRAVSRQATNAVRGRSRGQAVPSSN
jgi:hypothetical protein